MTNPEINQMVETIDTCIEKLNAEVTEPGRERMLTRGAASSLKQARTELTMLREAAETSELAAAA